MFYRTTVTIHRPYSGLTPLGVTKVIVEAETKAENGEAARERAAEDAKALIGDLDHVTKIETELS
jgi:hypothetical protein